jgi:hypothetical protein
MRSRKSSPILFAEVPGFNEERATQIVNAARHLIESGELKEKLAAAAAPAPTTDSEASLGEAVVGGELSGLEAKLRAEVAAMDKKSKEN